MDLELKDVAEMLSVTPSTIEQWIVERKIPAYRIKDQYRFNRSEIESWVISERDGAKKTPFNSVGGTKQFSLYRAVNNGGVIKGVEAENKEELISKAVEIIATNLSLDKDVLLSLLLERESLHSTGLGRGIAIPHTRDFLLSAHQDAVTVVFLEKPIDFDSLDGKPVFALFFLLACDDKRHLHLLAKIAHFVSLPETRSFLAALPEQEQLMAYIREWEGSLKS